jgi:hypothetical protein
MDVSSGICEVVSFVFVLFPSQASSSRLAQVSANLLTILQSCTGFSI